ncbi:MAG: hypothetical protein HY907_09610 [Deltaproteobacteria bacterium]|nr:hypothetical protein [Deltaproteobacteria bacterium]
MLRARLLGIVLPAALALLAPGRAAASTPSGYCLGCHAEPQAATAAGRSVHVAADALAGSVHDGFDCVMCHSGLDGADVDFSRHQPESGAARCVPCHREVADQYRLSVHGLGRLGGASDAARCGDCHGSHEILAPDNPQSPVYKRNLPFTCARCHSNPGLTEQNRIKQPNAAREYLESIHARGLIGMGLVVAPSCNDCHGVHDIRRDTDEHAPIHRDNIPATCGKCHVGVREVYALSIHGVLEAKGDARAPVCTTCHTVHGISDPTTQKFKLESDERCGKCHGDRLERYRETYHGKAAELGRGNVAACFDCHGHHDIQRTGDPRSHLAPANILATCRRCHPDATENFTQYQAHADHSDREHYPIVYWVFVLMTSLLVGTFGFFGVHTVLWLVRSIYLYMHDSKTFREAKLRARNDREAYVRFSPFERFLHLLVISSFLLLVITGMPLKFYYTDWARGLFDLMGGPEVAGALHRFGAIITLLYFTLHLMQLGAAVWHRRKQFRDPESGRFRVRRFLAFCVGPDSPVPTWQDVKDFVAHQKWFFGRGPKPQFDRWTYWEKFDYLAVFWGVFMIGASGLIMWFPEFFTRFLPGWMINVALVVHSDEALLAAGFIFTFHFFNVHFRIERFPMDPVIFSGRITREELEHERGRWLKRLQESGELEQMRVGDEWAQVKKLLLPIGVIAFTIGVALIALIYWAMSSRLLH